MKFLKSNLDNFLKFFLVVETLIIFRNWFLPSFPNLSTDISYDFISLSKGIFLPFTWRNTLIGDGMGSYVLNTMWSYPTMFIFQNFLKLHIPFWFQMKYLAFLPSLLISYLGFKKLNQSFKFQTAIAWLFYVTNTYFILLLDGGQLNLVLAYSFFPLVYYFYKNAISTEKISFSKTITYGLSLCFISSFDIRLLFPLYILIGVDFIVSFSLKREKKILTSILKFLLLNLVGLTTFALLNLYWIVPGVLSKKIELPQGYGSVNNLLSLNFTSVTHSLFVQQPHWYLNIFGKISNPIWYFGLLPLFVILGYLFVKNKNKRVFMGLLIVGIFLTKGANPPLSNVYTWLFTYIPGFNVFRDSTKFFVLISLSYSLLLGMLFQRLKKEKIRLYRVVFFLLLSFVAITNYPVLVGKLTGTFSEPPYLPFVQKANQIISSDASFSRSLWLPVKLSLGYVSYLHPSLDAIIAIQKRPFEVGIVGAYEQFNFLREASYAGQLLKIAGIKYIAYPFPDERRQNLKQDNIDYYYSFLDQLTNLPWIDKVVSSPPVAVLQTKEAKDHFFIAPKTFFVVGSDQIYSDLVNIPGFDLSKTALIFSEEGTNSFNNLENIPISNIILYHKKAVDLAASIIGKSKMIFPASDLARDPTSENPWWKRGTEDFLWMRNFLQTKYRIDNQDFDLQGGYSIAEGNQNLDIKSVKLTKGNLLLARVMKSSKGGIVQFWQGDSEIGEVNTMADEQNQSEIKLTGYGNIPDQIFKYDKAEFNWYIVGKLKSDEALTIKTLGDLNVVNAIMSVTQKEWDAANELTNSYAIIDWDSLSDKAKKELFIADDQTSISYTRISPTEYKVNISGLNSPETLAFSESYDSLWTANGSSSYPLYSLINGFMIDHDGNYNIYFSPQKYVNTPLFISGLTLTSVIFLLLYPKLRKKL